MKASSSAAAERRIGGLIRAAFIPQARRLVRLLARLGITARVAIEMAGSLGWDRYVGFEGRQITMSTFGASAPLAKLQDKFGFTLDHVVDAAKSVMEKK